MKCVVRLCSNSNPCYNPDKSAATGEPSWLGPFDDSPDDSTILTSQLIAGGVAPTLDQLRLLVIDFINECLEQRSFQPGVVYNDIWRTQFPSGAKIEERIGMIKKIQI